MDCREKSKSTIGACENAFSFHLLRGRLFYLLLSASGGIKRESNWKKKNENDNNEDKSMMLLSVYLSLVTRNSRSYIVYATR